MCAIIWSNKVKMPAASPMFRKLLAGALLLIVLTVGVLDSLLARYAGQREVRNIERRLAGEAAILAGELLEIEPARYAAWVAGAARRAGCRITLVAGDGSVLADSEFDPRTMENHGAREEIAAALRGRQMSAIRHSATLNRNLLYVAVPATGGDSRPVALRLAVPLEQVEAAVYEVRLRLLEVSLLAAGIAIVLAFFYSRRLSRRITQLKNFAEGLLDEHFEKSLPPQPDDELGALARSLNSMAAKLRDSLQMLRLEAARREAILAGMVEGVMAVNHELCVTFCNQAFARAVGARHPVPENLPVLELVRDPAFIELLSSVLVSGDSRSHCLRLTPADDRWYEVRVSPLAMLSGRGALAILHDITEIERLERIRRDFVANVSHELRTPLAAIQGYAETLLNGALEDPASNRKFVEIISAHAVRLNQIASDLLALSELESSEPAPAPEKISLRPVLEAALRTVEPEASARRVAIEPPPAPDLTVLAHPLRLEQVLVNLLDNAVKFNREGGRVWIECGTEAPATVWIRVSDNGIGIPSEDLPRIFERFYRVDKARSRRVGGTGLGLSIVKHALERMGGSITVESKLGVGSSFTVRLPAA